MTLTREQIAHTHHLFISIDALDKEISQIESQAQQLANDSFVVQIEIGFSSRIKQPEPIPADCNHSLHTMPIEEYVRGMMAGRLFGIVHHTPAPARPAEVTHSFSIPSALAIRIIGQILTEKIAERLELIQQVESLVYPIQSPIHTDHASS